MEEHAMADKNKTNLTEFVFILDRSGSMSGLEGDTISGYNSMLARQQTEPGEARITTVLFDHQYEVLHDRLDLKAVSPITEQEYFVRGSTALLDALGRTIHKIGSAQKFSKPEYRADKVIFIITTDGMENASCVYTYGEVKAQIERQKSRYGWEFIFLGANIDAVETAARFGIDRNRAQNYHADSKGSQVIYEAIACATVEFRKNATLSDDWKQEIEKDYHRRGSRK
jgi:uncharacterized protein YegL